MQTHSPLNFVSPSGAARRNGDRDPLDLDRVQLIQIMNDAFADAVDRVGGFIDYDYRIGGNVVRLRFAGKALVRTITRAFGHLACSSAGEPDLVIRLWDSCSTGRPLPLLVSTLIRLLRTTWLTDRGLRGEILEYNSQRMRAALHGHESNMLSLIDLDERSGIFWVDQESDIPWYETGAPLRTLLYWWFARHGRQMVHGGAIGTAAGGLLLGGKGSSGKSTTALASLGSCLRYAGDDYTLVSTEPEPFVYSLYSTAKVKGSADFARFPWMASGICNGDRIGPEGEKPMLFLHEHQPDKIISGFPLKAIVLPRYIAGTEKCKVIPVAPESALKAIAQSTITQLTGAGGEALRGMSELVHRLPCYLVGLGEDLAEIPNVMIELLAKHA